MITSDINKNIMMQPQTNTNSAVPITSTAGILNQGFFQGAELEKVYNDSLCMHANVH